ncbi:helix-turn-helix domain-containing protein [[Ruminococcus] torques]|uniref:helix-turn-helix domain-containing protein n=1 Tax=[Ruminococcus] torques TaxID=33039 RepID=UPI00399B1FC6
MRINEIIKERRLAKGFTQEQIANYLGVTAPAVNKWEKGTSCPDIVLLPALARLLDTDLNTLLSFQDDLSEKEVALFLNEVSEAAKKDGFEAGYSLAIGKIKEYPTCDLLLGNVAMLLNGLLLFQGNRIDSYEKYEEEIEALFQRVMQSDRIDIREQAQAYLISKLMEKQDYEQAQKVLDTISKKEGARQRTASGKFVHCAGRVRKSGKADRRKVFVCHNRNSRGADDVNGDRIERKADGRRGIYCGYRQAGGAGI